MGLREEGGEEPLYLPTGGLFATGYQRVVFGDRGPYVEFTRGQIVAQLVSKFANATDALPPENAAMYFVWLCPRDAPKVKVYWQVRPVEYADYRRGLCYVWPYQLTAPGCVPGQASLFGGP